MIDAQNTGPAYIDFPETKHDIISPVILNSYSQIYMDYYKFNLPHATLFLRFQSIPTVKSLGFTS